MNLDARSWRPASFFRDELSSGLRSSGLRCVLCPHECLLADGEEGLCHARRRRGAIVETATYAVAVKHLDTIERKPLYHYRPGSKVLTIAAPGCSLSCHYCQNFRLSQSGRVEELGWRASSADPHALIAEARAHHAAIGFSYSEPSLAIELAMDMAALARPAAIDMIWKTNGFFGPEVLAAVAPLLSAANIDIKAADDDRHRKLTGGPLAPVLETLRHLAGAGVWIEVSTPVIPGINADAASLEAIARHIASVSVDIPWHLVRFNPDFKMRSLRPTWPSELEQAADIAARAGLRYTYIERASGGTRDTACPACGTIVIERGIWEVHAVRLRRGACPACGCVIAGRWENDDE